MKKITKINAFAQPATATKTVRVAAYCRVSTAFDAQLESLETQRQHFESYIRTRDGWELQDVYYERGISGTHAENRPELKRLMQSCKLRNVDLVLTKSISRFARNTTDCLKLVRKLQALGVPIYFEKENINTADMESELFLSILSSLAQDESTSQSANIRWSVEQRFKNGSFVIATPPYGYKNDHGTMRVVEAEAKVVQDIFKSYLAGRSTTAIAEALNKKGVAPRCGKRWSASTIGGILKNEKYTGDVIFQKTYTDFSFRCHKNTGEKAAYLMQNHHEALIDRKTFQAAANLLCQRRSEKGIVLGDTKYLLRTAMSGKIICGACGSLMKRQTRYRTSGAYKFYGCTKHLLAASTCPQKGIREEAIQAAFMTMLNKLSFAAEYILKPLSLVAKHSSPLVVQKRTEALAKEECAVKDKIDVLTQLHAHGYLKDALFIEEKNKLVSSLKELSIEAENLRLLGDSSTARQDALSELYYFVKKRGLATAFDEEAFSAFVDHVEVRCKTELSFHLVCGLILTERVGMQ